MGRYSEDNHAMCTDKVSEVWEGTIVPLEMAGFCGSAIFYAPEVKEGKLHLGSIHVHP
jgi:hypothetical protein